MHILTRRQMIKRTAQAAGALAASTQMNSLLAVPEKRRFKIGACDWSIGKVGDVSEMELAKKIGLDGLQISMGSLADDMNLRHRELQQEYLNASQKTGVEIASLAIGEMNNIPYKNDERAEQWV